MFTIAVGQKYPFKYTESQADEFSVLNFFGDECNCILIGSNKFTTEELQSVKNGDIKIGVLFVKPLILVIIEIDDFIIFDCPLNVKLYQYPVVPNLETDQMRMLIELHCIDSDTKIVNAIRLFTLAPETSRELVAAAKAQLSMDYTESDFDNKLNITRELFCNEEIRAFVRMRKVWRITKIFFKF